MACARTQLFCIFLTEKTTTFFVAQSRLRVPQEEIAWRVSLCGSQHDVRVKAMVLALGLEPRPHILPP